MVRILVVDDDMDILLIVKVILDKNGFDATISDEPLAIDVLIGESSATYLEDINMPPHDGRVICKRLKASIPTLPILLFSANTISQTTIAECCADGFMAKPFEMQDLIGKILSMVA